MFRYVRRRRSMEYPPLMSDMNIMLLGMTGSGKSASGNTILGGCRKKFKEDLSPTSVTRVCDSEHTVVNGQTVTVIDTVGLSDTEVKVKDAQTQIERMIQKTNVDVFLLVIRLGETFTNEKSEVVKWIQENFGANVIKHTIVLFTHGDMLCEPIEKYVNKCKTLRSFVDQCSGRFHVFNNKDEDPSQVTELLKKINTLRKNNKNSQYSEQDYAKAQRELLVKICATGAAVGGAVGGLGGAAVGGGAAAGGGAVALAAGIGATGGAVLLAVAFGAGVFYCARKYESTKKHKHV